MNKKLFLTRSDHDIGNSYMSAYCEEILAEAEERNWKVEKSEFAENEKKNVASRLANNPNLVVFNGHGTSDTVCGHKDQPILESSQAQLLAGTVSFIRACACLGGLGPSAVKNGAKAVVGYNGDLWLPRINEKAATPLTDPSAKPVLEASNTVALKLLKGATVREAVNASKNRANKEILQMLTREEPYDSPALKALITNNFNLNFEGNADATA